MKLSIIYITFQRPKDILKSIDSALEQKHFNDTEIIIIDNDKTSDLSELLPKKPSIRYFKQNQNLGVAEGRNEGIRKANGEILIFIDDDAYLGREDTLIHIRTLFSSHSKLGCVAFKIINHYSGKVLSHEFPHPKTTLQNHQMLVSLFIGAGHAIRKSVFDHLGLYLDLTYWGEELEYSYRMIKNGYEILYVPEITVFHKVSPSGRLDHQKLIYYSFRNRFYATIPHVPFPYIVINLSSWTFIWLIKSIKVSAFRSFIKALGDGLVHGINLIKTHKRKPLRGEHLKYLKSHGGRLWF
ncbi:glycosyltransferase [candidate division KSB1 bacterium]|nr:glycosyltransferase [candidate division KSB1 bacterium]